MPPSSRKSKRAGDADPISSKDPYVVLGVPCEASQAEIKTAYRKLALKNHPDKAAQSGLSAEEATARFASVGAAYEILGDENARKEYDSRGQQKSSGQRRDDFTGFRREHRGDPFAHFGMSGDRFSDPFELFERMFRDAHFGQQQHQQHQHQQHQQHQQSRRSRDPFDDPFFSNGGFGMGGGMGGFGGMGGMGGFGGMGGMMGGQMSQMMADMQRGGGNMGGGFTSSSYSSSTGGRGGRSESVSTSTQIVNGKRQTVTERTVIHPDGRRETTREVSGDDGSSSQQALEDNGERQQRRRIAGSNSRNSWW
mmetsp:Transcript_39125/g.76334  ORF Transcript_39125/g.76334 Transcript_39125/m.76334 type:complete len:309 (+) Transcript_39125:194-1120(+)